MKIQLLRRSAAIFLPATFALATACGGDDLKLLSKKELLSIEPNVRADFAIFSPETGVLDVHEYMKSLEYDFLQYNGVI